MGNRVRGMGQWGRNLTIFLRESMRQRLMFRKNGPEVPTCPFGWIDYYPYKAIARKGEKE